MSVVAPPRCASPTRNSSLRALLPPPARPVRSSRLTKMRGHRVGSAQRVAQPAGLLERRRQRGQGRGGADAPGRGRGRDDRWRRSWSGILPHCAGASERRNQRLSSRHPQRRRGRATCPGRRPVRRRSGAVLPTADARRPAARRAAPVAETGPPRDAAADRAGAPASACGTPGRRPAANPRSARCTRSWCVRPVTSRQHSSVSPRASPRVRASVRYSVSARAPCSRRHHSPAVQRVAAEPRLDVPGSGQRAAPDQRQVLLVERGVLQRRLHGARFGHQEQPGGALVEPLDQVRLPLRRSRPARPSRPFSSVPEAFLNEGCTTWPGALFTTSRSSSS